MGQDQFPNTEVRKEGVMARISSMYKSMQEDPFFDSMEITFRSGEKLQKLLYEKVTWTIGGEKKGLRYGENPDQPAAFYRLVNGNLEFGDVRTVLPGRYLLSDAELLQSGKHPGKINITDVDNGLNILRHFASTPCCVILKHNNPSGAAVADTIEKAYRKAYFADRIAAFGGVIVLNRPVTLPIAEMVDEVVADVVAAPEYEEGVLEILGRKKNLRVMRIGNIERLGEFSGVRFADFKSLIDGGIIVQLSQIPEHFSRDELLPAETMHSGERYAIKRTPTGPEKDDMIFGWLVESGVTSNSVIYVKDGATVGIGTGDQDRVGVAERARDKAYIKASDRLSWERYRLSWYQLTDREKRDEITAAVGSSCAGLKGSVMVSDAYFPFRDGVDVGLNEGVTAVIQPGGSLRDFEVIEACNERGATMVFSGQRLFKH